MPGEEIPGTNFDEFLMDYVPEEEEEEVGTPAAEVAEGEDPEPAEEEPEAENEEEAEEEAEAEEAEEEESEEETEGEEEEPTGDEPAGELSFTPYAEALFAVNGWEYDSSVMPEDSLNGFKGLIENIVKSNVEAALESNDPFANDDMKRFNELVSKGAKPEEAYKALYSEMDYDNVDLDEEGVSQEIVRRYYKETTKFNDAKIEREIKKLEDLDELESEAMEGIDILKQADARKDKDLEKNLELQAAQREEERVKVIEQKKASIRESKTIAGYKVDNNLSDAFTDYLFKADDSGKSGYQKFVETNPNWDLEAAMFAFKKMNKEKMTAMAETEAVKVLKSRIFDKKKGSATRQKPNRVIPQGANPDKKEKTSFEEFIL